mgnify:CR=1 FL=1
MDQKQTVIIFSTAYLPLIGGAELAIKEITDRIGDFDFVLFTARMRRDLPLFERLGNVEVHRVGIGFPLVDKMVSSFLAGFSVLRLSKKRRVCLFWSVMVSYVTITPVLLKMFGFYKKVPFLLTLQEGDPEQHIFHGRFGFIAFWWRKSLRYANHVQAISEYLAKLAKEFGYNGPLTIVPNGVDTKIFYPRKDVREKNVIITTSRLVKKNGVDLLIYSMQMITPQVPDAELIILGDGVWRKTLEDMAHKIEKEFQTRIVFHGEVLFDKVPDFLARASIFVRPSRSEGLGTAFLEAMAMEIPIVATRVGGIPDFLEDEKTGLFANEEDAEDIAKKVIRLLTNEALYNRIAINGRMLVQEKYSWDAIANRMKVIFHKLCAL